jgi:hypothetical protein
MRKLQRIRPHADVHRNLVRRLWPTIDAFFEKFFSLLLPRISDVRHFYFAPIFRGWMKGFNLSERNKGPVSLRTYN